MFTEVTKAEYVNNYKVRLWFNNHVTKVVDLLPSLKDKVFETLKDLDYFKRFTVKYNTLEWESGADFAPEYLYMLPDVQQLHSSQVKKAYVNNNSKRIQTEYQQIQLIKWYGEDAVPPNGAKRGRFAY